MSRSILDYFSKKHAKENLATRSYRSPLSCKMIPSTIAAANTEVMCVMNSSELKSRGKSWEYFSKELQRYNGTQMYSSHLFQKYY